MELGSLKESIRLVFPQPHKTQSHASCEETKARPASSLGTVTGSGPSFTDVVPQVWECPHNLSQQTQTEKGDYCHTEEEEVDREGSVQHWTKLH